MECIFNFNNTFLTKINRICSTITIEEHSRFGQLMMKGHHDDRMIETIVYLLNFVHWLHFIYALMEVLAKMSVTSDAMFGISAGNIKNENIETAAFRIEYKNTHTVTLMQFRFLIHVDRCRFVCIWGEND